MYRLLTLTDTIYVLPAAINEMDLELLMMEDKRKKKSFISLDEKVIYY